MKSFCLVALMIATAGMAARAESNTNAAPRSPRATDIYSDSADFDGIGHAIIYSGHVRVTDPDMKLTCAQLVADLPQSGGRVNHIVAETNVVIDAADPKGETIHATGDRAVYDFQTTGLVTNETVTLTGNAEVENAMGWMTGEPIVWDRATGHLSAKNQHMRFRDNLNGVPADTNAPSATTSNPVATKTNLPPGTIQNIDEMAVPPKSPQP
jgi:lipopolysaccharide transport protein LptA